MKKEKPLKVVVRFRPRSWEQFCREEPERARMVSEAFWQGIMETKQRKEQR
jgi:hypothetical protein